MTNAAFAGRAIQPGFDPYAGHSDTGWFGSKLVKSVSRAATSVVNQAAKGAIAVSAAPGKAGAAVANRVIPGSGKYLKFVAQPTNFITNAAQPYINKYAINSIAGSVNGAINALANPNLNSLVNSAQQALKLSGPLGAVGAGALGAMKAGLQGKNLEAIAWAAAQGAAPESISRALSVAERVRHGGSIIDAALKQAQSSFLPGTSEMLGFNSAVAALKTQASKAGLGEVRRALLTEGSKRAFDAAIGVVSNTVKGSTLEQRANGIPNIALNAGRASVNSMQPNLKSAVDALKNNPGLMSVDPSVLASRLRTNTATVNDAMRRVGSTQMLPWRSMSPHAIAFVRKYNPHAPLIALRHVHTDVSGLDQSGLKYIVEKGDGPWAIAQKLTGNGNRWRELLDVNKDKKPSVDKNVWVGEKLNLPLSWQKPAKVTAVPAVALPAVPLPSIAPIPTVGTAVAVPAIDITPSVVQGKSILVAWSKTDGINQAGLTDYGLNVADLGTTMGPRDTLELASFQNWNNKTLPGANLNTSGALDAATLSALQAWAEARATAALPSGSSATPVVEVIPAVVGGTAPPGVVPALPSGKTATPAVKPQQGGSSMGPIALGAVVGGLLFGVPGAVIGAAGGAAIS